jgi:hypothetical protein
VSQGTRDSARSHNSDNKPEPITKMGLLINLTEGTVLGFSNPVRVTKSNAVSVSFEGRNDGKSQFWMGGDIDRITGTVIATMTNFGISYNWELHCKPAKRMF